MAERNRIKTYVRSFDDIVGGGIPEGYVVQRRVRIVKMWATKHETGYYALSYEQDRFEMTRAVTGTLEPSNTGIGPLRRRGIQCRNRECPR